MPVEYVHFLGKRTLDQKKLELNGAPLPEMMQVAYRVRADIMASANGFRIASCIRDPIARQISHLFKFPEFALAHGVNVFQEPRRAAVWMVEHFNRRWPLTWFDDHVSEPLGIDLFDTPFDWGLGGLRLERGGMKFVIVRLEDPANVRAANLDWLMDQNGIHIPKLDASENASYSPAYKEFCKVFVPPTKFLEEVYQSRMMKHFYSDSERQRFLERWSRPRSE